jgi:hypothetical protein
MRYDSIQWVHPSTTVVAGPSNSGKTTLISRILEHKNHLFTCSTLKTVLFYNQSQEIYRKWSGAGLIDYSQKGIPRLTDFEAIAKFYSNSEGAVIIVDDLGAQVLANLDFFEHIFVVLSHHLKLSVFLVVHNLFEKGLRKISLNTNRFVITANHRDQSQIGYLSRQAFPGSKNFLTSVYNHILSSVPNGYLILDFSQNRNKYLRISTQWFSNDNIMVFTEQPEKCPGDGLKTFRCYHLIADNIYKLLSSGHYQNSCNNFTNNNNSLIIPGIEKDLNRNISNNCNELVKQIDNNTQNNSGINSQLEITESNITPELASGIDNVTQTDSAVIKDRPTQTEKSSIVSYISSPPHNNTIKQPIKRYPKPNQLKPKPVSKTKKQTITVKERVHENKKTSDNIESYPLIMLSVFILTQKRFYQ